MHVDFQSVENATKVAIKEAIVKANVKLATLKRTVPCKAGCHHCCSRLLYITVGEALVIRKHLIQSGKWRKIKEKCEQLQSLSVSIDSNTWFLMNTKCPVLNNNSGLCEAYEVRPPACATHFVGSAASSCDPWSTERNDYEVLNLPGVFEGFAQSVRHCLDGMVGAVFPIPLALLVADKANEDIGMSLDEILKHIANNL